MAVPKSADRAATPPADERQRLAEILDRGLDSLDAGRTVPGERVRGRVERFFAERRRAGSPRGGA